MNNLNIAPRPGSHAPPLFLSNTTALETGTPLIISQKILHTPSDTLGKPTVRLDAEPKETPEPFPSALTLEDINSSPAEFPLAFAAMASAAFPIGMEPLELRKYGYNQSLGTVFEAKQVIHLFRWRSI